MLATFGKVHLPERSVGGAAGLGERAAKFCHIARVGAHSRLKAILFFCSLQVGSLLDLVSRVAAHFGMLPVRYDCVTLAKYV